MLSSNRVAEEFLLALVASMFLVKRYDFFDVMSEKAGFNIADLERMEVSLNFKANICRFGALFMLQTITDNNFQAVQSLLERGEKYFLELNSDWGLGLIYNLMARTYVSTDPSEMSFIESQSYLVKAIETFSRCEHHRGLYISYEDIILLN